MGVLDDSFLVSYLVLLGYTGITAIEAIRTPSVNVRHIMNIETTASIVASLVYGMFYEQVKTGKYDLKTFTHLRYLDWMITTPLLILGLLLFYNQKLASVPWETYASIVALDWSMLLAGFLGEQDTIPRMTGFLAGFVALFALFFLIYTKCLPKGSNPTAFFVFAFLWSMYGVAYLQDEVTKNLMYNILDVNSKAIFGVGLWMYFGKVLKFDG
jgi:bacteriorhodopsin